MEKLNELISNYEKNLTQAVKIDGLEKFEGDLNSLNMAVDQISERKKRAAEAIEGIETDFSIEEYVTSVSDEISKINETFTNIMDLTKKLETDEALKQFLFQKLDQIFEDITEETSHVFNLSALEIFNNIVGDLKTKMEQNIINRVEKELYSIKTGLGEFKKISGMMDPQFSSIYKSISGMKEKFENQLKAITLKGEIVEKGLPKVDELTKQIIQDYIRIQNDIVTKLSNLQQAPVKILKTLRDDLTVYEAQVLTDQYKGQSELKMSYEEIQTLKQENIAMKAELDNVSKELEKVTVDFEHLAKAKDQKIEMREVLALVMTLLVEVFGAQPHSKLLFLLHGQKVEMDRTSLMKASGISGAMVRKALADLDAAKLVDYDVESQSVKLLKRIY
ncbi:MAG: hypothetical protein HWN66_14940 [Candidatus Helarchaeota archaeon]|nr:hypothetical protein [Candidatus Helarchaeota archaeon]